MFTYKAVVKGQWQGGAGETRNIFYAQVDSIDEATGVGNVTDWLTDMLQALIGFTSNKFKYYAIDIYHDDLVQGWMLAGENSIDIVGTDDRDPMPHQIAPLVVARTATKRKQGKKYLAGMTEGEITDGQISPALLLVLQDFLAQWIGNNEVTGGVTHNEGMNHNFYPFIGGRVDRFVATQRRRKPSVGI